MHDDLNTWGLSRLDNLGRLMVREDHTDRPPRSHVFHELDAYVPGFVAAELLEQSKPVRDEEFLFGHVPTLARVAPPDSTQWRP
jgi:hypothetical protein